MSGRPTVMIPYDGPCRNGGVQDVVLHLRPEANGVRTESCMLKVLRDDPAYRDSFSLAYLANLPGDFIAERKIVERRYGLRERFAREGGAAFTPGMRRLFEQHFGAAFEAAAVVGAYEALSRLGMSPEELFDVWVEQRDFARIHQQSVKRIGDLYVVNYDIPALLGRDTQTKDVFAMILRSFAPYARIRGLVDRMCAALEQAGIISVRRPPARVFHVSTGPFMQIADGIGYVRAPDGEAVGIEDLSFGAYLAARGVRQDEIQRALDEPIMGFRTSEGVVEKHLFDYTHECSFAEALERLRSRADR